MFVEYDNILTFWVVAARSFSVIISDYQVHDEFIFHGLTFSDKDE